MDNKKEYDLTDSNIQIHGNRKKRSLKDMLEAFKIRNYLWYWITQFLSGIGIWAQAIAQSWLILNLTHSAIDLGIITMLQFLPILLFSLFGGVIADRLPRKKLLIFTQIVLVIQAIILGILVYTHNITIIEVGILALLLGTTNALNGPTQQSFVPELVGRELVPNAIALNSVQFNTSRMIGGAIGGLAIALWGISGAIFLNAISYIPIIIVLIIIQPAYTITREYLKEKESSLHDLSEGLKYAFENISIQKIILLFGIIGLLGFNWQVAVPLIARYSLHQKVIEFGDLMSALGAGSLIGAIIETRNNNTSDKQIIWGGIALGICLLLLGLTKSYILSLILLAIAGFSGIIAAISTNTLLQLITPDKLRGRVMAIYILLMGGTTPIGAFIFGEIAGYFSTGIALIVFGGITIIGITIISVRKSKEVPANSINNIE
jgi:MFS family permease